MQVSVTDDQLVDAASAAIVNAIPGTSLSAGDRVNTADIDTQFILSSGGSIVFGLTFVALDSTYFSGSSASLMTRTTLSFRDSGKWIRW